MFEKAIQFLKLFFSKYLLHLDISNVIGFSIGLLLFNLSIHVGLIIMAIFSISIAVYHIIYFGYFSRNNEQINSSERFLTMMIGFSVAFIALGCVVKTAGITEKDKFLNIGLVLSILITVTVLIFYVLKSEQLNIRNIPFIRNTIACIVGIAFFLIPIKINTKESFPIVEIPEQRSEPVLREIPSKDTVTIALPEEKTEIENDTNQ